MKNFTRVLIYTLLLSSIAYADAQKGEKMSEAKQDEMVGSKIELPTEMKGSWSILYFYPKDDTPGCTAQACSYRDKMADFEKHKIKVFGISADGSESHGKFKSKYSLNFQLLSDPDKKLAKSLKVGTFPWLSRDTFLFDDKGVVRRVWRKVSPKTTAEETLNEAIAEMGKK